ncbi:unnamed protein product [Lepidochelys olivacea]
MGSSLSALQVQHRNELQYLLRKAQHDCPARELTLLLQEVRAKCPWYPEAGSLKLADWERLGQTLHKEPRAPVQALHAWHLCRDVVQRVASDRPSLARLVLSPPPSAPAVIPPPGDATQRVALERPSSAPTEELPILPPPSAPAAIPPPALPPVPLLPPPPWPSPPEPVCDHPPPMGPPGESSASAQKLSLVQQMVHAAKARSDLTAEELADLVSVCPVTWQNDDQGNPVGTWTTLPYSVVREVKKAIREFGLTSTFVRGLIEGMGAGYSLIPEDWKMLLRMMLSPSQYVIWLSEYRQMAERQAQVYREQGIIYEHLAGEGQFATIGMQSQLPPAVFPIISTCAQHAFKKVPDSGKPTKSFVSIRQGALESFLDFTNRLQEDTDFQLPGEVCAIPTQVTGPLPAGFVGLVLPRSHAGKQGFFVIPGVIDADYTGIIKVQVWTHLPQSLPRGRSIAQLILVPYQVPAAEDRTRGGGGFGSTLSHSPSHSVQNWLLLFWPFNFLLIVPLI